MRHGKKFNKLGRTHSHRAHMLANMATSLILHKRITTTVAKAKALRVYIEPLLNRAKDDSTHSRRMVFRYLQSKEAVLELFRDISVKIADRPGGYTRILKTGSRLGDNADMCIIELVDYNENLLKTKEDATSKSTRRRRSKKKTDEIAASQPKAVAQSKTEESVAEDVIVEESVVEDIAIERSKVEAAVEDVIVEKPKAEKVKEPKVEEPKEEKPKAEEPKAEEVKEPKVEKPKVEKPKIEEVKEAKAEEPKVETPKTKKAKEPKAEEPKAEETNEENKEA